MKPLEPLSDAALAAAEDAAFEKLARSLHDELNGHFVVIRMAMQNLAGMVEDGNLPEPAKLRERAMATIAAATRSCNLAYDYVHSLADGRVYPIEDAAAVLRRTADVLGFRQPGMKVVLSENLTCFGFLPPQAQTHLTLLVKEGMTNAFKYSKATLLQVRVSVSGGCMTVRVEDNGCGLRDGNPSGSGIGMRSMRYRANAIGATFAVLSPPTGGCHIEVVVPLSATFERLSIPD